VIEELREALEAEISSLTNAEDDDDVEGKDKLYQSPEKEIQS
jgi:hypothetical protein